VLGPRLLESATVVAASDASSAAQLLDGIDAHKLRSSMTLFLGAAPAKQVFAEVLDRFSDATADPATDALLCGHSRSTGPWRILEIRRYYLAGNRPVRRYRSA